MLIIVLFCTPYFLSCTESKQTVEIKNGVLDLRNWDFNSKGTVSLAGKWEFYWQELLFHKNFKQKIKPQKTGFITVPSVWNDFSIHNNKLPPTGYATYRLTVLIKNQQEPLALKILDFATSFSLYINGKKITSSGKVGKTKRTNKAEWFPHVASFVPQTNMLEIIVHVSNYSYFLGGFWNTIHLGNTRDIIHLRERNLSIELFLFGSILIIAIYHLGLFILRRNDYSLLYFSIFSLLISLRAIISNEKFIVSFFKVTNWAVLYKLILLSFYIGVPVFIMFIQKIYSNESKTLILRFFQIVFGIASFVVLFTPTLFLSRITPIMQIATMIGCMYVIYILIRAFSNKREGAGIFLIGFSILSLSIINDVLFNYNIVNTFLMVHFGVFIFIFSQSYMLSIRYSNAFHSINNLSIELAEKSNLLEELNLNLEQRVIKRTEELQEAMDELETVNHHLHETNSIAKKDMEMAITVQRNFFPDKAPETKEWDIAYAFEPMSGVSGDFYDFYLIDDTLSGVGIFDVSGHGISSGLITTIAKSIILNHFTKGKYKNLHTIIYEINVDLQKELINVNNYITGVLLRFNNNSIEYVNAGHPSILLKTNDTVKELLNKENELPDGCFLGIEPINIPFEQVRFTIERNDTILLYSDCLIEELNKQNDSLGISGLMQILEKAPDKGAKGTLQFILDEFYTFLGGKEKLNDDLTIMVLKKQ